MQTTVAYQDATGTKIPVTETTPLPVAIAEGGGAVAVTPGAVTPGPGAASEIAAGGTAVILVTGPCNGGYITNPSDAAAQAIATAENAYVDPVAVPGSTDGTANGTTSLLAPGQSYSVPPLAAGSKIRGNAATSGHKLTVVVW